MNLQVFLALLVVLAVIGWGFVQLGWLLAGIGVLAFAGVVFFGFVWKADI